MFYIFWRVLSFINFLVKDDFLSDNAPRILIETQRNTDFLANLKNQMIH